MLKAQSVEVCGKPGHVKSTVLEMGSEKHKSTFQERPFGETCSDRGDSVSGSHVRRGEGHTDCKQRAAQGLKMLGRAVRKPAVSSSGG